jgi:glucokinase
MSFDNIHTRRILIQHWDAYPPLELKDAILQIGKARTLEERHAAFKQLEKIGRMEELLRICINVVQTDRKVATDTVTIPEAMFFFGYEQLIDYLATLVANRGEIVGASEVGLWVEAKEPPVPMEKVLWDVKQAFSDRYGVTRLHANFGKSILWRLGQIESSSVSLANNHPSCPVDYDTGVCIGIDIGATNIKAVVLSNGRLVYKNAIQISDTIEPIGSIVQRELGVVAVYMNCSPQKLYEKSIVIGVPGLVNPAGDILDLPGLERSHPGTIASLGEIRQKYPGVRFINDANVATMYQNIAHRIQGTLVVNTLGTGVGLGIARDGRLLPGPLEEHIRYDYHENSENCGCGMYGCFQAYASARGLVKRAVALSQSNGTRLPEVLERKIKEATKERIGELAKNVALLLQRGNAEEKALAREAYKEHGAILMVGYSEIARVLGVTEFHVILVGGLAQGKAGEVIRKGILEKQEISFPNLKLTVHPEIASTPQEEVQNPHYSNIPAYWHGAVGAALISLTGNLAVDYPHTSLTILRNETV